MRAGFTREYGAATLFFRGAASAIICFQSWIGLFMVAG